MTEIERLQEIEDQVKKVIKKYNEAIYIAEYYQLSHIQEEMDKLEELVNKNDINMPESWYHSP